MSTLMLFPLTVTPARYDYLWFENFELTKNAFLNEHVLVRNLGVIKNDLSKRMVGLNLIIKYNSEKEHYAGKNHEMVQNFIYRVSSDLMNITNFIHFTSC